MKTMPVECDRVANRENITKTPKKCSYKPIKKNNNRRIDAHLRRVKTTEKRKR